MVTIVRRSNLEARGGQQSLSKLGQQGREGTRQRNSDVEQKDRLLRYHRKQVSLVLIFDSKEPIEL